jgi:hypothetical protein
MELTLNNIKKCMKYSSGFLVIKVGNFAKGIMPKIIIELNLGRKYSNPHLNLNT